MKIFRKRENVNLVRTKDRQEKERIENVFEDLTNLLRSLEKGDFTAKPKYPEAFCGKQKPIMEHALGMIKSLSFLIHRIKNISLQIKMEMEQISHSTEELATSTQSCSEEVLVLDKGTQQIVEGIEEAAEQTETVAETCMLVGKKIESVTVDIKEFENLINTIYEKATLLKNILNGIQKISEQINLFSFNTRIEAARMEKEGKTIAAIAAGLSDLNKQTSDEAKKSEEIINGIFQPIEQAKQKIETIVRESSEIKENAASIVNKTTEIAKSTKKQSVAAEEISTSIHRIRDLVENNAAASEQSAASVQEVLSHLTELECMLEKFEISES